MSQQADPAVEGDRTSAPYTGNNLVFVAGCPRSGTTWLQQLLSCHPDIQTVRETHLFDDYFMPLHRAWHRSKESKGWGVGLAVCFTDEEFKSILHSFLTSLLNPLLSSLRPGQLFLEKTPSNALYLREITDMLPKCRIIYVLRDPRDVVASMLAASRSWGANWAPKNPLRAIRQWKHFVRTVDEASPTLPTWQFMQVRYEDLYANTEAVLLQCAGFLGITWNPSDLARAIDENMPAKAVRGTGGTPIAVRGELQKRLGAAVKAPPGFVRKARVGSWKTDLNVFEKASIWALARREMAAKDYPWPFFLS